MVFQVAPKRFKQNQDELPAPTITEGDTVTGGWVSFL